MLGRMAAPYHASARVYDLLYDAMGRDTAAEAADLDALVQQHRPGAATLLDVACGTGSHLAHLAERYDVAGVDVEPAMLAEARRRLPGVEFVEGDMRSFDVGRRFDAVVCLFSSVGYLPDSDELDRAVATMAAHLTPGGVLVVDGWLRPEAVRTGSLQLLADRDGDLAAARIGISQVHGRRTHLEMHHLIGTPDHVEYVVEHHDLTVFTDAEYRHACTGAGLAVDVVPGPMPGRDRYVGVLG
jgi:SAM-dependent methyltransferase